MPNLRPFRQNDENGIANSEDPDQTAPLGAVCSGYALVAQTYLSENLGSFKVEPYFRSTLLISSLALKRKLF